MGRRIYSRQGNGRFRRGTLENTFGLTAPSCPACNRLNPYEVSEPKPDTCHACGAALLDPERYAEAVLTTLAGEFSDLQDQGVAKTLRTSIAKQVRTPNAAFEFITDNPVSARWRLKADQSAPGRIRLACYRAEPTEGDRAREETINNSLRAIRTP